MILKQNFTLAQIGEILEKSPGTMRTHITRGLVTGQGPRDTRGGKPANKHGRFSFYTLMEFALAYHLNEKLGLQLDQSFEHAVSFTHLGNSADSSGLPDRRPALPFHHEHGDTICAISEKATIEVPLDEKSGAHLYYTLRSRLGSDDFIVVNASRIFERVCWRMSMDYRAVLDEAYGETNCRAEAVRPEFETFDPKLEGCLG